MDAAGSRVLMAKSAKRPDRATPPRERVVEAARRLFGAKGFHATTTAELATEAAVSVGQIYRFFASKDDIVVAIAEQNIRAGLVEANAIFDAVERAEISIFDAIKTIAAQRLSDPEAGLFFEIVAESCRNDSVAEQLRGLTEFYRQGLRRLASLGRPDGSPEEIDGCADLLLACFLGLFYRRATHAVEDIDTMSANMARLMERALGLASPHASSSVP